jgi:hypothetical protein
MWAGDACRGTPSETADPEPDGGEQRARRQPPIDWSVNDGLSKRSGVSHNQAMGQTFTLVTIRPVMLFMPQTFTFVIVGAVVLFVVGGVLSWLTGASVYDRIGEGGLTAGPGDLGGPPPGPPSGSPADLAEREREIRQMLKARSDRQVRSGGQPLDIEAELAKLTASESERSSSGKHDAHLAEEVRQLVIARNERRERRGEPPLDVEAEVRRTLAELDP